MSKIEVSDLVNKLKDMAIELGRIPTRDEFIKQVKGGHNAIRYCFGSNNGTYAKLLLAAGFQPNRKRKIDDSIFNKPIERHLEEYEPLTVNIKTAESPTIACISDIHFPWESQKVLDRFYEYISKEKPNYVVLAGDAADMLAHSKFPKSMNNYSPKEEMALARQKNEDLWKNIKLSNEKAQCFQMLGNHCTRPLKRILETYPEAEDWVTQKLQEMFTFPGVKTIYDPREELIIGNIMIHHGYRTKLGDHMNYALMNFICGHTHQPGVHYRKVRGSHLWEMNCGLAGDMNSKAMSYTHQKSTIWVNSFGVVDKYGPRVIAVD